MIEDVLKKLRAKKDLEPQEVEEVFERIAAADMGETLLEEFLSALSRKGESGREIAAAARVMRRHVRPLTIDKEVILDTCGTGGDSQGTFNISTAAAFVVAGCGITVAKHGNRSVSSHCGSADLMEALGVNINAALEVAGRCVSEVGIGFLFAPLWHPVMGHVQAVRRKMKTRTIFNIMGPLINPARPTHQLVGVFDSRLVCTIGAAFKELGGAHVMVVSGQDGLDEVSTTALTDVYEIKEGHEKTYCLDAQKLGFERGEKTALQTKDLDENKHMVLGILKGLEGPARDIVVLNSACCLYLCGKARTIQEGIKLAQESIDAGHAVKKLNKLIEYTTI